MFQMFSGQQKMRNGSHLLVWFSHGLHQRPQPWLLGYLGQLAAGVQPSRPPGSHPQTLGPSSLLQSPPCWVPTPEAKQTRPPRMANGEGGPKHEAPGFWAHRRISP